MQVFPVPRKVIRRGENISWAAHHSIKMTQAHGIEKAGRHRAIGENIGARYPIWHEPPIVITLYPVARARL